MDRISELSDDLLQGIILHLRPTRAAARTSALSRRWRHIWAGLPDLVLVDDVIHHRESFLDTVDDALAPYTAGPAVRLRSLSIIVPNKCETVPDARVATWLLFASRRLAGEINLRVPLHARDPRHGEIELPPLEGTTAMSLVLANRFLLRRPPAGVFVALADLEIRLATLDGQELEVLVFSQCPRLEKLTLQYVTLVNVFDLSISSASLRRLTLHIYHTSGSLNIAAPNLEELRASLVLDLRVAAPNLTELLISSGEFVFADAVRHLRRLEVTDWSAPARSLLRQLDSVDELRLHATIRKEEFERFMDDTNNLPKWQTLSVDLTYTPHVSVPIVLHLLTRNKSIRKLVILMGPTVRKAYRCLLDCPCRLPHNTMTYNISLDSLEELQFRLTGEGVEYMEVLKLLLSISSLRKLKNVEIDILYGHDIASLGDEVYQKVRTNCPQNIGVKLNVSPNESCQNRN